MMIAITGRVNPDLDAVGCAIAYQYYFEQSGTHDRIAVFQGKPHPEAVFICEKLGLNLLMRDKESYDAIIFVDFSEMLGAPEFVANGEAVIEMIDHRSFPNYQSCPNAKYQIEFVGAAATLIAEKFLYNNIKISAQIASLLYCAILSNTVNFTANVSTWRDKKISERLITMGADPKLGVDMFSYKTDYIMSHLSDVLLEDSKQIVLGSGTTINVMQLEVLSGEFLYAMTSLNQVVDALEDNSDDRILIIQDMDLGKTRLYISDTLSTFFIQKHFIGGPVNNNFWEMPKIFMRKEIIPMLQSIFE